MTTQTADIIDGNQPQAADSDHVLQRLRLWPLYLAVFNHAIALAMTAVALPFFAKMLGAKPWQVGLVGAIMTACYATGCLVLRPIMDRVRPRVLTVVATSTEAALIAAIAVSPALWVLVGLVGIQGLFMSMFWPPVMGWLSTGAHGRDLNRRLRMFNMSWCGAMIAGPAVGGLLFELRAGIPFYGAAIALLLATALLMTIVAPDHRAVRNRPEEDTEAIAIADKHNARMRWIAWIGLFFGWLAMGMLRWQLPNLTEALSIPVWMFGVMNTMLSATMAVAFVLLGHSESWHHRRDVHAVGNLLAAAVVLCLCWANSSLAIIAVVTIAGLCLGQIYARSIYHSAAGAGKRAASRLAVHEITLAIGFVCGSLGSGLLTDHVGLRAAYPVCAALLAVGMFLQIAIGLRKPANGGSS